MMKRLLAILLSASMILMLPAAVFADDEGAQVSETPAVEAADALEASAEAEQPDEQTVETGWNKDRTQYRDENGNLVTGLFKAKMRDDVGALFYADSNGNVVKDQGLITVSYPDTRYLRTTDSEGHTGFREVGAADQNSYTYLIGTEGAIVETAKIYTTDKGKVLVQDNGTVRTTEGLVAIGNVYYYVGSDGYMKTDAGWVRVNGNKYRVEEGGVVRTEEGPFKVGDYWYVIPAGAKGVVCTSKGIVKANNKLYYVRNTKGQLGVYRAYKIGSKVCHVNKNGLVKVGRHKWKDKKYYYSSASGYLKTKTGMITQDGKRFLVKKGGLVVVNKKFKYRKKTYISGSNGVVKTGIFKWKGDLYYANEKGALNTKAGIIKYEGYKYFVGSNGIVAVNKVSRLNGNLYGSDSNGHLQSGIFKNGSTYYYADSDYEIETSQMILKYKGNYYFNKKGGGLARNEWVNYKSKHYYAGDKAAFKTSKFTISGVTFSPDKKGEISDKEYKKLYPDDEDDDDN